MNVPRFLAIFSIALFTIIGLIALFKDRPSQIPEPVFPSVPFEIEIQPEKQIKSVVQKLAVYDEYRCCHLEDECLRCQRNNLTDLLN